MPPDGIHFVLLMATGILIVGLLSLFAGRFASGEGDFEIVFAPDGLLGGCIWALGNFLTVPILKHIGLGLGLAIWGGSNLIVAFVVGVLGLGSVLPKEHLSHVWMGALGIAVAVGALVLFSQVKPTLEEEEPTEPAEPESLDESLLEEAGELKQPEQSQPERAATNGVLGISFALVAGIMYGFQFVPLQIWNNRIDGSKQIFGHPQPSDIVQALRFLFSQFVGIFLTSLVGFVGYCIYTGNKPKLVCAQATLPSIVSGMVWAVGGAGGILATSGLGNAVGFPLVLNLSFIVNSAWSILYYREIRGRRNLMVFGFAFGLNLASSILISMSKSS